MHYTILNGNKRRIKHMTVQNLVIDHKLRQWVDSCIILKSENTIDYMPLTIGFPEASPTLVIILSGHLDIFYKNKSYSIYKSLFLTYIEKPILVVPSSSIYFIKITFKSLGVLPIARLTRLASKELIDSEVLIAEDVFGKKFRELEANLFDSSNAIMQQGLLEKFLTDNFFSNTSNISLHIIDTLTKKKILNVDELCCATYMSPRTLQRWFSTNMVISPKFYLRIIRFSRLVNQLSTTQEEDYLDLAINAGYYDQNHMIKEIKLFTNMTPTKLILDHYFPVQIQKASRK